MNDIIIYFLETSIIFAVFYAVYHIWLINDKNFRFSRFYLLTSSLLAISLPLFQIPVISAGSLDKIYSFQEAVQLPEVLVTGYTDTAAGTSFHIPWVTLLMVVYLAGAAYLIFRILSENIFLGIFVLKNHGKTIRRGNYKLVNTGGEIPTS